MAWTESGRAGWSTCSTPPGTSTPSTGTRSPPARYGAATLVVVNKLDQVRPDAQEATLRRVTERVRERNPHAHVVGATAGRIDPALLYDVAADEQVGQLTFRELLNAAEDGEHDHVHADAVTVRTEGCVDPGALIDLLEEPPPGVYRMKGTVAVRYRGSVRRYVVNVVGASVHVAAAPANAAANALVAIGMHLDVDAVRAAVGTALAPIPDPAAAQGIRRLQRYRRLSI